MREGEEEGERVSRETAQLAGQLREVSEALRSEREAREAAERKAKQEVYTVPAEPPIMYTLIPTMDKLFVPCLYIVHTFLLPKKGKLLNNGENKFSEVPLRTADSPLPVYFESCLVNSLLALWVACVLFVL